MCTHIKFIRRRRKQQKLFARVEEEVRRHKGGEYSTEMNIKIHPIANILMEVVVGCSHWGEREKFILSVCMCVRVALMISLVESK